MDVERLMKDLSVDQLENIQLNLQKEMEQKKEELREMVGRRYRDVLDACTEVRAVHAYAEELSACVSRARSTHAPMDTRPVQRDEREGLMRFIALHRLLPAIGAECENADALSDAYALLLVEQLHKQLSTEHHVYGIASVVSGLTHRVLRTRRELISQLNAELGELSNSNWTAVQLSAIALIQGQNIDQLLETYLDARKSYITHLLKESCSLLDIVQKIKLTMQVVHDLFAQGNLSSILQVFGSHRYRPVLIDTIVADQAFSFAALMDSEIEKVNRVQRERKIGSITTQKISEKCAIWMEEICELAQDSVETICAFYEKTEDIIEFLKALSGILTENWPRIGPNSALYQKLFENTVMDKFKSLIHRDVIALEQSMLSQLPTLPVAPQSLFEKRSTNKFDPLLASGISEPLKDLVAELYSEIQSIRETCLRYEKVGMEGDLASVRDSLAENTAGVLSTLCSPEASASSSSTSHLRHVRVCLAVLHVDPASACLALNKDGERIQRVSQSINKVIEDSLVLHLTSLVDEFFSEKALSGWVSAATNRFAALQLTTEWEKVDLPEVGIVEVPVCLSASLHCQFFALSCRVAEDSISHLLTKNVKRRVINEVSQRLLKVISTVSEQKDVLTQRSNLQLLFDVRILHSLFPSEDLKAHIAKFESRIDPFDLSLLGQMMHTNVRLAVQRMQLLCACLILDMLPSRDAQLTPSFMSLTDILPRPADHPQTIPAIPRLDRTIGEDGLRRMHPGQNPRSNKLLANSGQSQKGSSAGLSALYDKFAGSWFGN